MGLCEPSVHIGVPPAPDRFGCSASVGGLSSVDADAACTCSHVDGSCEQPLVELAKPWHNVCLLVAAV
eukprot:10941374-Lingulodinium_polyedra.AAC.1